MKVAKSQPVLAKKKVLIIAYYWPPAGGPGVQRWLKFVKYLPEFGFEPVVYVPENPNYPIVDHSLVSEIPKTTTVLKHPIFEPYKFAGFLSKKETQTMSSGLITAEKKQSFLQKMLLYVRGNFFVPDARKFWVKPSVKFLSEYISEEKIETIITTGPPHSLHLIGLRLKRELNLKWIADFRDPWTNIGYQEKLKLSETSQKKHQKMEEEVLQTADLVLTTSFSTKKEFQTRTEKPIKVITNGFDEKPIEETILDRDFTISHIGSLLSERNPRQLWEVFSELIAENEAFDQLFRLQLIGKTSQEVLDSVKHFGLEKHLDLIGYVPHSKAMEFQQKSQVLLLLEIDSPKTKGIIPGKLFEYMRSERPILAIGPKNWDVQKIISETQTGNCFGYQEKEAIKQQLLDYFSDFQQEKLQTKPVGIQKYGRKELTKKLVETIRKL
ncbi:MAG TPA: glycosyltransferase family 4 protein [Flavobacteriaceae bacterium]|nr:glycosyltransferase family 4 protein [Flavobacteriaceae bacterium]